MPISQNYNENIIILLGKSAQDNHDLINSSHSHALWIHMDNTSSGHVVIQPSDDNPETFQFLNEIFLNLRNNNQNDLIITSAKICFLGLPKSKQNKFISNNKANFRITITKIKNLITTENIGEVEFKNTKIKHLITIPIILDKNQL